VISIRFSKTKAKPGIRLPKSSCALFASLFISFLYPKSTSIGLHNQKHKKITTRYSQTPATALLTLHLAERLLVNQSPKTKLQTDKTIQPAASQQRDSLPVRAHSQPCLLCVCGVRGSRPFTQALWQRCCEGDSLICTRCLCCARLRVAGLVSATQLSSPNQVSGAR
jgi:hypothetical protein